MNKGADADDPDPAALLDRIEMEMPKDTPEAQRTMNNTLAAIGIKPARLCRRAIAIGEKIGLCNDRPVSQGNALRYLPVRVEAMV